MLTYREKNMHNTNLPTIETNSSINNNDGNNIESDTSHNLPKDITDIYNGNNDDSNLYTNLPSSVTNNYNNFNDIPK